MIKSFNYPSLKVEYFESRNASLAIRTVGEGDPLILLHGWPVHGYTWRFLLTELSKHFKCYIVDMPGMGDSKWSKKADFNWDSQAKRLMDFIKASQLKNFSIIGNDSGGSIARIVAMDLEPTLKSELKNLLLINTEMPHHRPPFVPLFQKTAQLPFAKMSFRKMLKNKKWMKSKMGFKGFYADKNLLDDPEYVIKPYIQPLLNDSSRLDGMMKYLIGCDMTITDTFVTRHQEIDAKVLLIWGENCSIFPADRAEKMTEQFQNARFRKIPNACFMPHEEKPKQVLAEMFDFLKLKAANH